MKKYLILIVLALGMMGSTAAIDFNSSTSLQYYGGTPYGLDFEVATDGQVNLQNHLNLSGYNLTNYYSNNLCGEYKAVQKIHENGTITCTPEIEFTQNTENLSETLAAGNVANQTIFMDGNNLTNPNYVDGVNLDNPGNAINLTGNRLGVDTDSLDDSEIADNSLTNSSIDSSTSFSMYELTLANNLNGNSIVNTNQISSNAVTNDKINTGAVASLEILDDSINESDLNTTDEPVNDEYLTYDSGTGGFTWVENPDTDNQDLLYSKDNQPTEAADNQEIGIERGANITFQDFYELDNQTLTVFNDTNGDVDTIQIDDGNNITLDDDVEDGDADPTNEYQTLSQVLSNGTSAGSYNISLNSNSIENINRLYQDDSGTNFFESTCDNGKVVEGINSDGTYSCVDPSEDIEVENLSETLNAGNIANQSIFMEGNNISNTGYVDGIELDTTGLGLSISGNRYRVASGAVNDTFVDGNSLTNASIDSYSSFTMQDLKITNDLTGTDIVDTNQINSDAVTNTEINSGAVNNDSISSFSSYTIQDLDITSNLTGSDIVNRDQIYTGAVGNNEISLNAVNRSQISQSECENSQVLQLESGEWICASTSGFGTDDQNLSEVLVNGAQANQSIDMQDNRVQNVVSETGGDAVNQSFVLKNESIGTDDQTLTGFNNTGGVNDTIRIENGNNITIRDDVVDADADPTNEYQSLSQVLSNGTSAGSFNISLNSNSIENVNRLYGDDAGSNFFESACNNGQVVEGIKSDGTYSCVDPSEDIEVENLSETLAAGNVANQSIDMDSSVIENIGASGTDFGASGGLTLANTLSMGSNSVSFDNYNIYSGSGVQIGSSTTSTSQSEDLAFGKDASASGASDMGGATYATAIGYGANAQTSNTGTDQGVLAIGRGSSAQDQDAVALGPQSSASGGWSTAVGAGSSASGDYALALGVSTASGQDSLSLGTASEASASGAIAIGDQAEAPNSYEATFGNLNGQELDLNITGNATIHGQRLDLKGGNISNYWDNQCGDNQVVDHIYDNGTVSCVETSDLGTDNQDLQYSLDNQPTESTDDQTIGIENGDNITFKDMYELDNQNLTVFNNTNGNDDTIQIDDGNNITIDDATDDADADPTNELQNLSEVLVRGNQANRSINMSGNNINDVGQINSNGQELEVGGTINATGNNLTEVSRVEFENGDSATGETGEDMCLGDRC